MESNLTPPVPDDAPALAGASSSTLGNSVRTRTTSGVSFRSCRSLQSHSPTTAKTSSVEFDTEPMAWVYIYQTIYDLAQSEVADRLQERPSLLKGLGLNQPPSQQNISYAWQQFSQHTKTALEAAARGIAIEARDHDVISEALISIELDEGQDETDDKETASIVSHAHVREYGTKFDSNRANNRVYEDEQILDLFSDACLTQGSAQTGGFCSGPSEGSSINNLLRKSD